VAEPPDHAALHLVLEVDGIDDLADVDRDPDLVDPDALVGRPYFLAATLVLAAYW
jgi:hypothetical protein